MGCVEIAPIQRTYLSDTDPGPILMRFRLTYEGELKASGRDPENGQRDRMATHKQAIRKVFHGQLKRLWETNKFLSSHMTAREEIAVRPGQIWQTMGGIFGGSSAPTEPLLDHMASNFQRNGYHFVPLVCMDFSLLCSLNVLFLRGDHPVGVISAGDLDNRADSDDLARVYRFDLAQDSEMISPTVPI